MLAVILGSLLLLLPAAPAYADVVPDEHGTVFRVPEPTGSHWLWVADRLFRHSILFDGDDGRALGMLDITQSLAGPAPYASHERGEVYVVEPVYSRGHRGERTDYVTIYDAHSLEVNGEIALPTKSAEAAHGTALAAVLDGGRFLVVLNQTTAASVTVVDLQARRFAAEIATAGCSLVYPVGPRRFGMLCDNGTVAVAVLDADGRHATISHSEKVFDTVADPLTEKGVRDGERWLFASFEGFLHEIDFSVEVPLQTDRWSLLTPSERAGSWRTGGIQHLALHRQSRRLYSLVHKGGSGSHKDAGSQIWVYDLATHERVQKIRPPSLLPAFVRPFLKIAPRGFLDRLLGVLLPNPGVHSIVVTQDAAPVLFVRNNEVGAVGVLDAKTGAHLRDIEEAGFSGGVMALP